MSLLGIIVITLVGIGLLINPKEKTQTGVDIEDPVTIEDFIKAPTNSNKGEIILEIGESSQFTKEEIVEAAQTVEDNFDFLDSTLIKIWYNEEESNKFSKQYIESGKGSVNGAKLENVIVLLSNFYVDESGDNPVLNPGSTYENYQWVLIRDDETSAWKVDDWGY